LNDFDLRERLSVWTWLHIRNHWSQIRHWNRYLHVCGVARSIS